jgi:hypothetical protein
MLQLAQTWESLREYGIRDASDYAEVLVTEALGGERETSGVNRGFDVYVPKYRRIEVKCRQLPPDGRIEERVEVAASKEDGFDYLAIVIFMPDFHVRGAVLVPYAEVWRFVELNQYNRISYSQACQLEGAIDITVEVATVASR